MSESPVVEIGPPVLGREYRIGRFTLRPHRQLMDGDTPVTIGRKPLELLSVLAQAGGALVTKDELMTRVWPNVIVEENAIQAHIASLRKTLGGDAALLSTVHGLGYRLTATPRTGPNAPAVQQTREAAPETAPEAPTRRWTAPAVLAVALVLALAIGGYVFLGRSKPRTAASGLPSIAVLAFLPADAGDPSKALADRLTTSVADSLSHYNLTVVRATPPLSPSLDSKTRASVSLGADFLVDGHVVEKDGKLSVTTELIDAHSNVVVYSFDTPQPTEGKADIADEIASHVALSMDPSKFTNDLGGKLTAADYTFIARGNDAIDRGDATDSLDQARQLAGRHPDDADLQSAVAFAALFAVQTLPSDQKPPLLQLAHQSVQRASQISPNSPMLYLAKSLMVIGPMSLVRQEQLLRTAMRLNPSLHVTYNTLGELMLHVGRTDEGLGLIRRSIQLDPMSEVVVAFGLRDLLTAGDQEDAARTMERLESIWPDQTGTLYDRYGVAFFLGGAAQTLALDKQYGKPLDTGVDPAHRALLLNAMITRDPSAVRQMADNCMGDLDRRSEAADQMCLSALVRTGDLDDAFRFASAAYPDYRNLFPPDSDDWYLRGPYFRDFSWFFSPAMKPFRDDPRFWDLAVRNGLVNYWQSTGSWPDFCQPQLDRCQTLAAAALAKSPPQQPA